MVATLPWFFYIPTTGALGILYLKKESLMLHNSSCDIACSIDDTSSTRLSSYRVFFGVQDESAYAIYKWNEEINSRLMKLLGVVEVILRNKIHSSLSKEYSNRATGSASSNNWFNHVNLSAKTKEKLNKVLKKRGRLINPPPSPNIVISQMTFGFWPNLLAKLEKDLTNKPVPWDKLFPSIFPGLPRKPNTYWKKLKHREQIITRCMRASELRNRAAHLEPVWKFGILFEERLNIKPEEQKSEDIEAPKPATPKEAIARLKLEIDRALELLSYLSPTSYRDYMDSQSYKTLDWLVTEEAMKAFINHKEIEYLSITRYMKARKQKGKYANKKGCAILTQRKVPIGMVFLYP